VSKLANFLKRFGPEYTEWLNLHDEQIAMSERERILILLTKNKVSLPDRVLKLVKGDVGD
jgi:hypothetical protein